MPGCSYIIILAIFIYLIDQSQYAKPDKNKTKKGILTSFILYFVKLDFFYLTQCNNFFII